MINRRSFGAVLVALAVAGCKTTDSTPAVQTSASTPASTALALKSGDTDALAGVWKGQYYLTQDGFTGRTTLTLTANGPDKVEGLFEYNWRNGGYTRFPETGTTPGYIADNGQLIFDSNGDGEGWELTLRREGGELEFTARESFVKQPADLDWSRTSGPLPSEGGS